MDDGVQFREAIRGEAVQVSPSRTFILRPVATTLLMVGILLAGLLSYKAASGFGIAGSGLPDHPGDHHLSGRESGRDGFVGYSAAGTPIRPGPRPAADDFHQLRRDVGDHARVQLEPEYRRGRAGGPAIHQRLGDFSARRSSHAAALQQNQSGRHARFSRSRFRPTPCRFPRWRISPIHAWRRKSRNCRALGW